MIQPTVFTWIIAVFGAITFLPLFGAQLLMILDPRGQRTKDLIIGKGEEWRDGTHFKSAQAFAWADWLVIFPLFTVALVGVFNGEAWGYYLWIAMGILSIYFSILFWVMEKEYTYPSIGWFAYYTYFWGFFLYWGSGALVYSFIQLL